MPATLSDRRWLAVDGLKKDHIVVGLVLGIAVFTVATLAITVIHIYQSYTLFPGINFPVSFHLEELAVILVMLVPMLVMSAGKVALVQGFFQRMLSEKYGAITGALIAAFIFMLVGNSPMPVLDEFRFLDTMYIMVAYGTQALVLLLTLVAIWYFGNKTRKEIVGLKGSVKNVLADIYERITRN